ncbi:MAG TPA: HEAT repeat domain-containing protein [Burkholderiales bacterium]|nr:HEAT repeat domain-containing protein [Burkholderiales bacterium]
MSADEHHPGGRTEGTPGRSLVCDRFLHKLAKTPDKAKRLVIFKACAKVRAPWVEELFWESLDDPCEIVRAFVFKELAGRRTLDLGRALDRLKRPPWFARSAVVRLLGLHRAKQALPEIKKAIEEAPNVEVRRAAAEALGEIGGEDALVLLVQLKKDPSLYVRQAAEEAIQKASGVRFV